MIFNIKDAYIVSTKKINDDYKQNLEKEKEMYLTYMQKQIKKIDEVFNQDFPDLAKEHNFDYYVENNNTAVISWYESSKIQNIMKNTLEENKKDIDEFNNNLQVLENKLISNCVAIYDASVISQLINELHTRLNISKTNDSFIDYHENKEFKRILALALSNKIEGEKINENITNGSIE